MTPTAKRRLAAIRKAIEANLQDLGHGDYQEVLEEVEADCNAKIQASKDDEALDD